MRFEYAIGIFVVKLQPGSFFGSNGSLVTIKERQIECNTKSGGMDI